MMIAIYLLLLGYKTASYIMVAVWAVAVLIQSFIKAISGE